MKEKQAREVILSTGLAILAIAALKAGEIADMIESPVQPERTPETPAVVYEATETPYPGTPTPELLTIYATAISLSGELPAELLWDLDSTATPQGAFDNDFDVFMAEQTKELGDK